MTRRRRVTRPLASRRRLAVALCAALALLLAACGEEDTAADPAPADPVTTDAAGTTAATATDAAATTEAGTDAAGTDAELSLIAEGQLLVGSDVAFEPFEFIEDGENKGFDIDLMNEIGERLGLQVEFVNTPFDGIFTALAGGQFDAIISAITITEERQETIAFSDPYFAANQALAVAAGSDIASVDDLAEGVSVGVQSGTTGEEYATGEFSAAEIVSFPTSEAAFSALEGDQIDAVFIDLPVVGARVEGTDTVELAEEVDTDELYGIGLPQDSEALRDAINAELEAIITDGTYEEIYSTWFEGDVPEQFQ
ncbi:MAG: basic amino acid ABC transporter substrate-binding protein [Euzebyales bacterium]|nr:basic amino acid ABC transporter substrate-binding protein [Euzebyales bacterium]